MVKVSFFMQKRFLYLGPANNGVSVNVMLEKVPQAKEPCGSLQRGKNVRNTQPLLQKKTDFHHAAGEALWLEVRLLGAVSRSRSRFSHILLFCFEHNFQIVVLG